MRPRSNAVWTSSSSGAGVKAPETTSASSRSSASSMPVSSSSSSSPAVASARAWAREPAMSWRARRQSNWVERDSSVSASAGAPVKRPPHRLSGASPMVGRLQGAGAEVDGVAEGGVARGGELGGHAVDLDEALGVGLVEGVAGVVGGEVEVVEAGVAAATGDHGAAAVQQQADVTGDVALGVGDEGVERALERREPLAVVDQLGPALVHGLLEAGLLALDGDVLKLLVGGDERDRAGGLVHLAGLDAHEPVLDDVDPAHALGAGAAVELLDGLQRGHRHAVERDGDALLEGDDDLVGHRREGRVVGVAVDVLGRRVPDVLEEPGLDGPAPHVLVDGEGVVLRRLDRQVVALGVVDGDVAGEGEVVDRRQALEVRGQGGDAHLEADLVVALAGAAVGHGGGAELAGGAHEVLDDHRAGQRRDHRVAVLVEGVGLEGGHAVLGGVLVAGVGAVGLHGPAVQGTLADDVEVLASLADVDGDGDDLRAGLLADPADGHRGVQPAGVGEDDALLAGGGGGHGGGALSHAWSLSMDGAVGLVAAARAEPLVPGAASASSRSVSSAPDCGLRAMTRTVSSPAMVPRTSGSTAVSTAEASSWAAPAGVRRTTSAPEWSADTSSSPHQRASRAAPCPCSGATGGAIAPAAPSSGRA